MAGYSIKAATAMLAGLLLAACVDTTPREVHRLPPPSAEQAIIFWQHSSPLDSGEARLTLGEINKKSIIDYGILQSRDWQPPASVDSSKTVATALTPGINRILVGACRDNFVPYCEYKCANVVLRLEAVAGVLYQIQARIRDDTTRFKIVDPVDGIIVLGPVSSDSRCTSEKYNFF